MKLELWTRKLTWFLKIFDLSTIRSKWVFFSKYVVTLYYIGSNSLTLKLETYLAEYEGKTAIADNYNEAFLQN